MYKLKVLICIFACELLSSCANVGPVAQNWSSKLREYQISPIFPPREDVYIGDVYLSDKAEKTSVKTEKEFLSFGILTSYIDFKKSTSDFYKTRPSFPTTVIDSTGNVDLSEGSDEDTYLSHKTTALKRVIFPSFLTSSVDGKGLNAAIPGKTLAVAFGLNANEIESASISVPQAESYAYPALLAYKALKESVCKDSDFTALSKDKEIYLITEVFYTRQMNITIDRKATSGTKTEAVLAVDPNKLGQLVSDIKAKLTKAEASQDSAQKNPEAVPDVNKDGINVKNTDSGTKVAMDKKQLEEILSAFNQSKNQLESTNKESNVPGFGFWRVQSKGQAVFVNGIFDKPIAIGYRGLKFENSDCSSASIVNNKEGQFTNFSDGIGTEE